MGRVVTLDNKISKITQSEIFTDFILNKKSLKKYIEIRKTLHERGVFSDALLLKARKKLNRLKYEDSDIYEAMYSVLEELFRVDRGDRIAYPIDFTREVLRLYEDGVTPHEVYDDYKKVLEYHYCMA